MSDPSSLTDAEVVVRTLENKEFFSNIVHRYEAKLSRYVRRLGIKNDDDIIDVLQDIFIKIYKNLNAYDQSLPFSSWAYRIAHNEAITHFRRKNVRPEGNMALDSHDIIETFASGDDLMKELTQKDDGRILREALTTLDAKYRDVIVLRYFEGKEYDEIADILEMPMGSVATRLYRAKDQLKHLLVSKLP